VTLASGVVALIVGLTWFALFSPMAEPPDPLSKEKVSPRRKWARRAWWVWSALAVGHTLYLSWSSRHEPHEVLIRGIGLATMAYPVVGVMIMVRRFRRTGQRPAPHPVGDVLAASGAVPDRRPALWVEHPHPDRLHGSVLSPRSLADCYRRCIARPRSCAANSSGVTAVQARLRTAAATA
jgi:hypothetical protein